jgi:hypothetical protein
VSVTIKLTTPIEGPDGPISEVVMREPKFAEVMLLGEPVAFARSDGGMVYQADNDDVIRGYIERLVEKPADRALLNQCSLTDTLKLREAVFGFFRAARKAISGD